MPSDSVYPAPAAELRAWTVHGKPLPLEEIPVERITGPVLTAGAGDDRVWASRESVEQIERRLTAHRFRFPHQGLVYGTPATSSAAPLPYLPANGAAGGFGGPGARTPPPWPKPSGRASCASSPRASGS